MFLERFLQWCSFKAYGEILRKLSFARIPIIMATDDAFNGDDDYDDNVQLHERRANAMVMASMFGTTESVSTGDQSHLKLPNVNSRSLCGKYDLSSELSQPFVSNKDNV